MACLSSLATAQNLQKIKAGDKIAVEAITYGAKGRDVFVENTRMIDVNVSQTENTYTLSSEQGKTVYQRNGHVVLERESPAGKTIVAENQRFYWMPPGADWSKPYSGSFQISNPNCGLGKMTFEATSKPTKFSLQIAGKPSEVDVQEVQISAKWMLSGNCGNGTQPMKFVYSQELDIVLERDTKVFSSNGMLLRGEAIKTKSVN